MSQEEKSEISEGSVVKFTRQSKEWKVEILHKDGGVSGRLGPFPDLQEATDWIKARYDVS